MKLRYKRSKEETFGYRFNTCAICEIITGDDSIPCSELDVFITAKNEWVDLHQAFKNGDVITDNYNTFILEPPTKEDRERGFLL